MQHAHTKGMHYRLFQLCAAAHNTTTGEQISTPGQLRSHYINETKSLNSGAVDINKINIQ